MVPRGLPLVLPLVSSLAPSLVLPMVPLLMVPPSRWFTSGGTSGGTRGDTNGGANRGKNCWCPQLLVPRGPALVL